MYDVCMRFEIRKHENAMWDSVTEQWNLSAGYEVVRAFDAAYPALARQEAEATVNATRTETTTRRIRGRVETLTSYLPCEALMAWRVEGGVMALVAV
jgi:hypothetical protein